MSAKIFNTKLLEFIDTIVKYNIIPEREPIIMDLVDKLKDAMRFSDLIVQSMVSKYISHFTPEIIKKDPVLFNPRYINRKIRNLDIKDSETFKNIISWCNELDDSQKLDILNKMNDLIKLV